MATAATAAVADSAAAAVVVAPEGPAFLEAAPAAAAAPATTLVVAAEEADLAVTITRQGNMAPREVATSAVSAPEMAREPHKVVVAAAVSAVAATSSWRRADR